MQSRQAQVIVIRSNYSEQDKRRSKGLSPHLKRLMQQGLGIWDSASITAGLNMVEEIKQVVVLAQIAILLVSIDFLNDPLVEEIEPLLSYLALRSQLHIIPILLSPYDGSSSGEFANTPFVNSNKPIGKMKHAEQEEIWVNVCSQVRTILQFSLPHLNSSLTEQYLHDLYTTFTKHREDIQVSLFSGSTVGTLNHGLMTKPDRVLLASRFEHEMSYDLLGSSQLLVRSASLFTGLAIAKARNNEVDREDTCFM